MSCVTDAVFSVSHAGYTAESERPHGLLLNRGEPVLLKGPGKYHVQVSLEYDVVKLDGDPERGPFKVRTRAYRHHILTEDLTESILFHWHPDSSSTYHRPHMHLGTSQLSKAAVLTRKTHIPTGRIAVEHVLQLLLDDFNVVPRRDDAATILDDCLSRFERWRTWV